MEQFYYFCGNSVGSTGIVTASPSVGGTTTITFTTNVGEVVSLIIL